MYMKLFLFGQSPGFPKDLQDMSWTYNLILQSYLHYGTIYILYFRSIHICMSILWPLARQKTSKIIGPANFLDHNGV